MRRLSLLLLLLMLCMPVSLLAQRDSLRTTFLDAESWFLFEEYAEALPLYQSLYEDDPGNANLSYKVGVCLLNDPYQKDQAIQYLLEASKHINPLYKENSIKEREAPPDVLYHLGEAYLVNELLNHAIEAFEEFLEIMDREIYDEELVKSQIQACKNAEHLKSIPVDLDLLLIDSLINTRYPDIRPVLSGDGQTMAFVTELPFYDGAFFTQKTESGWSYPQLITQALGFDEDVYPVALNYDGTEMLLYYDDDYIGNLYSSSYIDGIWTEAVKLGDNISTKYWESDASLSRSGQLLYFTSNRKGGYGGLDIYVSEKQEDGRWGVPVNLGPNINTRFNEESPYISQDGKTLYFSSYGHYNMGGYDIFFSKRQSDGSWAKPVNLGYPINTTDDDIHFQPTSDGHGAYYSVYSPSGRGRHDIYYMNIYSVDNPRIYMVTGRVRTEDGKGDPSKMAIFVIDNDTNDTVVFTGPDTEGEFGFGLKEGIYELHIQGEGYQELIRPLRISSASNKAGIRLEDDLQMMLEEKETLVFEGNESLIQLRDTLYEGIVGEGIRVPVRAPRGSTLITRIWQDSSLVAVDSLEMKRRREVLEIVPLPGRSRVELEMRDENGNIHRNEFSVLGKEPGVREGLTEIPAILEEQAASMEAESDPLELLLYQMQRKSEGALHDYLMGLDPEAEGITTQRELFEHLYQQAPYQPFTAEDVDSLLTEILSDGHAPLMKQLLEEQAEGPLATYLNELDLEEKGISSAQELVEHLREASENEAFGKDELREAMLDSLGSEKEMKQLIRRLAAGSDGRLNENLVSLDPDSMGIHSDRDLFSVLYDQAEERGYPKEHVDDLLAGELAQNDAALLLQHLIENSDGALKAYLEQLDLEAEGIQSPQDLLRHLQEVAEKEGFSMEDVRRAMMESIGKALEVERVFQELLATAEGPLLEILKGIDLRKQEIYSVEDLLTVLFLELLEEGFNLKEVRQLLKSYFPGYEDLIDDLAKNYARSQRKGLGTGLILLLAVVSLGLFFFILIWRRRREDKQNKPR